MALNKICDAADWQRPELLRIITDEFAEVPRFHRKQWEFAVAFRELERHGLLTENSRGVSFGSATEVMLYAVARRAGHIWATDLYGEDATWDIARTKDATQLVRSKAPFGYPQERLEARSIDMRSLDFADESFDFAYSSCAIEHIGGRADFVKHLQEVRRVLKPGGLYAFTTELTYQDQAVEMPGNFYFSRHLLEDVVRESGLYSAPEFDATLARHRANTPLPVELMSGVGDGDGHFGEQLFGLMSTVQLSSANVPFTSCLVVLRKDATQRFAGWNFKGWDESVGFIREGLGIVQGILEGAELRLAPFAWMLQRRSAHYIGHEHFFDKPERAAQSGAVFHTGYFWLGGKQRRIRVALQAELGGPFRLRLKVHRIHGATPWIAELHSQVEVDGAGSSLFHELLLDADPGCSYAVLAELVSGQISLRDASITVAPAGASAIRVT